MQGEKSVDVDATAWAGEAADKLRDEFGERLDFVGLQGSRARGEAREGSDIDLVVLLESVNADDLARFRAIVGSMERSELACGFVGATDVLTAWPRHELFQFYHDTRPVYGELPEVEPFTRAEVEQVRRVCVSAVASLI